MKNKRQVMILEIIREKSISTQDELTEELNNRGQTVTQATVSRDIRELHLIKDVDSDGKHRYTTAADSDTKLSDRQKRIFSDAVLSIERSRNIIVLHTMTGSANAAAETLDTLHWPEIIGCIAGDNTIIVIIYEDCDYEGVVTKMKEMLV